MADGVFELLKSTNRLPSPPGVAMRVLELTRSDDTSIADIAQTIGSDPSLSCRILRYVNSPIAGLARKVGSLNQAIMLIGLRGVKMIALSFSLVNSETDEGCPSFHYENFWSRSLAFAVAARAIAKSTRRHDREEAFIAGLLGRIGQLVLACGVPDVYETVLKEGCTHPTELFDRERELLGNTHLEMSTLLLQEWQLPEEIWRAIEGFNDLACGRETKSATALPKILYLADLVATLVDENGSGSKKIVDETLNTARGEFNIKAKEWEDLFEQIISQWRKYGQVLAVKTTDAKSFREIQDEARQQIAELSLATQLENQEVKAQNTELMHQATTDRLTGVANRSSFDQRLQAELDRAERTRRPISLIMFDVDHFKDFNDTYGHQAGDLVLQEVARTLENSARKMDLVARYGGEEFAVIAPECDAQDALALADRLRGAIQAIDVEWKNQSLRVTASGGVGTAKWPDAPKTSEQIIAAADGCLYEAKEAGRNRCRGEHASEPSATPT
jgi:two-component system, cell cycle response regulator